jgi:hypothetical protein
MGASVVGIGNCPESFLSSSVPLKLSGNYYLDFYILPIYLERFKSLNIFIILRSPLPMLLNSSH